MPKTSLSAGKRRATVLDVSAENLTLTGFGRQVFSCVPKSTVEWRKFLENRL